MLLAVVALLYSSVLLLLFFLKKMGRSPFLPKDVQICHIVFWVCAKTLTQFEWGVTLYIFFFECETARTP